MNTGQGDADRPRHVEVLSGKAVESDYDALAPAYAASLADELTGKPFDCERLDAFAARWAGRGLVADLGCGPGQVAAYLAVRGVTVVGLDLSAGMVAQARRLHPRITFEKADMLELGAAPARFVAAVAFYAFVHFDDEVLARALAAIRTALTPGGELLAATHLGAGWLAPGSLWEVPVGLRFRMFEAGRLESAIAAAGFKLIEAAEREPYPDTEYPSRRVYLRARA
ncbi:class I SAM-dependent methyltransferase [Leptolyngbya sp. 15MV]|nr:class I SAM-dependent methyltransferase [Leptolyngbya sp. 15MV]